MADENFGLILTKKLGLILKNPHAKKWHLVPICNWSDTYCLSFTCLHMTIFSYYLDAILDLRVKDMSEYKADARNRFPMFEVRIDLLTAKKKLFFPNYVIIAS